MFNAVLFFLKSLLTRNFSDILVWYHDVSFFEENVLEVVIYNDPISSLEQDKLDP